ncbi:acyltransferase [Curtobacterium sp. MCBD17_028]|uniref:acyltransferase family protein n=1 Tax=Curtobacterium sp. MCBD17_028 TaxID=2175670 RepID=UPI000DAAABAF|nr:acyltransferase [Curtobacterium sp. MCBD17_028]PZE26387.1 acyltransferase [Curtobacterium sp. MCBD17_028]
MTQGGTVVAGRAGRLSALDGLRGIAVALVVIGHATGAIGLHLPVGLGLFDEGGRGVTVFFVLSGFLITSILLREQDRSGRIDLPAFYSRRAFRILPAFYVFLAVVSVLSVLGTVVHVTKAQVLFAGLFIWDYAPNGGNWWLGHTWSLAIEEQFYLLWPLLLLLVRRRAAIIVAIAVLVLDPVLRVAEYVLVPSLRGYDNVMFHTRADSLIVGALLALLLRTAAADTIRRWAGMLWVPAVVYMLLVGPALETRLSNAYLLTVGWSIEGLCIAIIIAAVTAAPAGRLAAVLSWSPLRLLGLVSYSLYLWQQLFLSPYMPAPLSLPWVGIPAALALAVLSYLFVERPFLRMKRRFERAAVADPQPAI